MTENTGSLYAAFMAKDARFDGRFFVGVLSTGIYCRPVCRAKTPKEENCAFYGTAAAAEQAGFRPCLICRPELAPGRSVTDATANLAVRAARLLEGSCGSGLGLDELAGRLGCTDRHLRRVFSAEYNVSPVRYLQTCRLLLAKSLLTDTELPVLDVALAAGFGSLRRFNEAFKRHYRLTPSALRKRASCSAAHSAGVTLALGYRPPYRWEEILKFLEARAVAGVELVKRGEYLRTVRLLTAAGIPVYGWVRVGNEPEGNVLRVTLSESLLPVLPQALARVRRLFDLSCEPNTVFKALCQMNDIRPGLFAAGTRLPGCWDTFETSARAVLGQQITVKAAGTLAARLVQAFGTPVRALPHGLTHTFPAPEDILALEGAAEGHFGPLGVIASRARAILELARAIVSEEMELELCRSPKDEIKKLMSISGVGAWTAQYIAMRAMGWPDAFPETDAGIRKAFPSRTPAELLKMAERWRPWRSYATVGIWNSL